jgi:hypothetical protein
MSNLLANAASAVSGLFVEKPITLKVLVAHPQAAFEQLLRGVVFEPDGLGVVRIRKEYSDLAYLFTLVPKVASTQEIEFTEITLPSEKVAREFVANCIEHKSKHWNDLYAHLESVSSFGALVLPTMTQQMLNTERDNVGSSVNKYLDRLKLQIIKESVTCKGYLTQPHEDTSRGDIGAPELFDCMIIEPGSVRPSLPSDANPSVPNEIKDHNGAVELTMQGWVRILASNTANAELIAQALAKVPCVHGWDKKNGWVAGPGRLLHQVASFSLVERHVDTDDDPGQEYPDQDDNDDAWGASDAQDRP